MANENISLKNNYSRQIFRPLFRARWQSSQNIINDSQILNFLPYQWKTYFIAYIRQWAQWTSGFVPGLHKQDFFSTGIGTSIVELFVREIMSGGYRFDCNDKDTAKLVEEWAKENEFDNLLNEAFYYSNGVGNAFLKLTANRAKAYATAYPSTRAFVIANKNGTITRACFLDRFMANTVDDGNYWCKEDRILYKGKPYFKISLGQQTGVVTSPSWNFNINWDRAPEFLKEEVFDLYGDIEAGKWYELPFESIGVYNIKNKAVASALSDIPCYSDSSLHTALDILYSIDFNFTQQQVDMALAPTKVLVPKELTALQVGGIPTAEMNVDYIQETAGNPMGDDPFFIKLEGGKEDQTPVYIQPDYREQSHKFLRDTDLELLAIKLGLSTTTLANHLAQNGMKTATQVDAETDNTQKTVQNKRDLANIGINKMLEDLAKFLGWKAVPDITWNRSAQSIKQEKQDLLAEYQAGVMPLDEYLKRANPDLTDEEVQMWVSKLQGNKEALSGGSFIN